jgi:hypothetical protein
MSNPSFPVLTISLVDGALVQTIRALPGPPFIRPGTPHTTISVDNDGALVWELHD